MADMYLDTLAGNGPSILGISFSITTLDSLVSNSFIRGLLCSQIQTSDVNALQDFASSGTLNAFIPIAKAFSDRGETHLLTQIMLALAANYPTAMQPNEPALVKLLNSGAVNQLFAAINQMTTITVPSNGETLIDVLADTFGALVDDSSPYTDREGRTQATLLNLMLQPMQDMETAAQSAGVSTNLSNALTNLINTLTATYTDANGNTQLVYNVFVTTLGSTLTWLSQEIPTDPTQKSAWCDQQEQKISDVLQGRPVAAIVDLLVAVEQSPNAAVFTSAIVNLFTPSSDPTGRVRLDPAGRRGPDPDPADVAPLVAAGSGSRHDRELLRAGDRPGRRQADEHDDHDPEDDRRRRQAPRPRDRPQHAQHGAERHQTPPITTLMSVFSDIRNAGGPPTAVTASSLTSMLQTAVAFMDNQQTGLPHLFAQISATTSRKSCDTARRARRTRSSPPCSFVSSGRYPRSGPAPLQESLSACDRIGSPPVTRATEARHEVLGLASPVARAHVPAATGRRTRTVRHDVDSRDDFTRRRRPGRRRPGRRPTPPATTVTPRDVATARRGRRARARCSRRRTPGTPISRPTRSTRTRRTS